MDANHQAVADTALLVAAIRARESTREDRLFHDPFAERLAGERGCELLAAAVAVSGDQSTTQIVVRTRFWDEALLRAVQVTQQVVIVAAGMDARAYRMPWPQDTVVFELDQAHVMTAKADLLTNERASCLRVPVGIDLTDDWPAAVVSAGFNPKAPTVWLLEGLLQYLDEAAVHTLFSRIDALSAPGSVLLYEVVGDTLLRSPSMASLLQSMADKGAPWLFGTDQPEHLAQQHGWSTTVTDVAEPGNRYHRWSAPVAQAEEIDAPHGYFVEANK